MRQLALGFLPVLSVSLLMGCSKSATEEAGLSNSEAAAMVAEETKTTPAVFNVEGAPTVTFSVPDMMCEQSCVPTVRETLAAQPGAKEVKVELETKTATVAVDQEKFDPQAAVTALVDLQFTETKLVTTDTAKTADGNSPESAGATENRGDEGAPTNQQPNS
jgi:copper chaperone CopZ